MSCSQPMRWARMPLPLFCVIAFCTALAGVSAVSIPSYASTVYPTRLAVYGISKWPSNDNSVVLTDQGARLSNSQFGAQDFFSFPVAPLEIAISSVFSICCSPSNCKGVPSSFSFKYYMFSISIYYYWPFQRRGLFCHILASSLSRSFQHFPNLYYCLLLF